MIPVALLLLCCVLGAAMFWWLWTLEDWQVSSDLPWVQDELEYVDLGPIGPDWRGLV